MISPDGGVISDINQSTLEELPAASAGNLKIEMFGAYVTLLFFFDLHWIVS